MGKSFVSGKKRSSAIAPARRAALEAIREQRLRSAHMRDLLRSSKAFAALSARDRALATRLALGVVATKGELQRVLKSHLRSKSHIEPKMGDALELATYELLFLDTPVPVAVSQGVELVGSVSPRARGLANAVLYKVTQIDRSQHKELQEKLLNTQSTLSDQELGWAIGCPTWLVAHIRSAHGDQAVRNFMQAQMEPAPVFVAGNLGLHTVQETENLLSQAKLMPHVCELPNCYALGRPQRLSTSGLVQTGEIIPCDASAQCVALLCAPQPGVSFLEVGQGRGTKTELFLNDRLMLQTNQSLASESDIPFIGIDSEAFKVKVSRERLKYGWEGQTKSFAVDGLKLVDTGDCPKELQGKFDEVFVDAPCSGTGTLRRHPEIVWGLDPKSLDRKQTDSLPQLQIALLNVAATRVKCGGLLCYATCSVFKEEDEAIVKEFLASDVGKHFEVESVLKAPGVVLLDEAGKQELNKWVTPEGCFACLPSFNGPDGHFCIRLRNVQN